MEQDDWKIWQPECQEVDIQADIDSTIYALLTLPVLKGSAAYCWCCVDQSRSLISWLGA